MPPPFDFPLKVYDVFVVAFVWAAAGDSGFSPWSIVLGSAATAVVVVVIVRRLLRLAALRTQLRTPDHAD